jgi:hypothetical protein
MCEEEPYLVGGPSLIKMYSAGCSLFEVFIVGPEPVTLARGQNVGQADNVKGQALSPFEADFPL